MKKEPMGPKMKKLRDTIARKWLEDRDGNPGYDIEDFKEGFNFCYEAMAPQNPPICSRCNYWHHECNCEDTLEGNPISVVNSIPTPEQPQPNNFDQEAAYEQATKLISLFKKSPTESNLYRRMVGMANWQFEQCQLARNKK